MRKSVATGLLRQPDARAIMVLNADSSNLFAYGDLAGIDADRPEELRFGSNELYFLINKNEQP
jgi:hypothetical protein